MSLVTCPNQHLHGIMRPGTVAASSRCVDTEDSHLGRGESEFILSRRGFEELESGVSFSAIY